MNGTVTTVFVEPGALTRWALEQIHRLNAARVPVRAQLPLTSRLRDLIVTASERSDTRLTISLMGVVLEARRQIVAGLECRCCPQQRIARIVSGRREPALGSLDGTALLLAEVVQAWSRPRPEDITPGQVFEVHDSREFPKLNGTRVTARAAAGTEAGRSDRIGPRVLVRTANGTQAVAIECLRLPPEELLGIAAPDAMVVAPDRWPARLAAVLPGGSEWKADRTFQHTRLATRIAALVAGEPEEPAWGLRVIPLRDNAAGFTGQLAIEVRGRFDPTKPRDYVRITLVDLGEPRHELHLPLAEMPEIGPLIWEIAFAPSEDDPATAPPSRPAQEGK